MDRAEAALRAAADARADLEDVRADVARMRDRLREELATVSRAVETLASERDELQKERKRHDAYRYHRAERRKEQPYEYPI